MKGQELEGGNLDTEWPCFGPRLCWMGPGPGGAEWRSREHRPLSPPAPAPSHPRELDGWVFVELDVGSEGNADGAQIQEVLHTVISRGSIDSYVTSPQGFQFRRLGTGEPILGLGVTCSGFLDLSGSPLGVSTVSFPGLGLSSTRHRELTTS